MVINNLVDLVKHFNQAGVVVDEFTGWYIQTQKHGKWTISHGILRRDGLEVTSKEVSDIIK